jgi:peptide deformylase
MAILDIRFYPDPVLRATCRPVEDFNAELRRLAEDMVTTMVAAPGVGLAAPQVGVDLRLAVVDISVGKDAAALYVLVNPRIVEKRGEETEFEACLSLPGLSEKVSRPQTIRVLAQGLKGEPLEVSAEGFLARAICHEVDHLDGVLFVDHLRGLKRDRIRRQLKRFSRSNGREKSRASAVLS